MKKLMFVGILFALSSTSAFGEPPVTCTTNINHNPHMANTTTFVIQSNVVGQKLILIETRGGRARNNTGPVSFQVSIQTRGPEVIDYYNAEKDFDLMINYHPVNGQIQGVFTGEIMGRRVQTLVVCDFADPVQS